MTPIRYPLDFTPWQPGHVVGFAGTWSPISGAEILSVHGAMRAILKAAIATARERDARKGGPRG